MIDANDGAADFWLDPADWDEHDRTDPDSPLPGTFRHVVNFEVGDNERTVTIPTCEDRVSELRDGSYGEQLELRAEVDMGPAVIDPAATRAGGYGVLGTIVEDDIREELCRDPVAVDMFMSDDTPGDVQRYLYLEAERRAIMRKRKQLADHENDFFAPPRRPGPDPGFSGCRS